MWDTIFFAVCCACLIGRIYSEEKHCSRYHYEAQTLERIIRAEIEIEAMKTDIAILKGKDQKIDNDATKLAEKQELLQNSFSDLVKNLTMANVKNEIMSSMRKFCSADTMCSDVEDSECKWLSCKCKPGLSYHHESRKCLPDCGDYGYGNTYQSEIDAVLYGFSAKTLKSISLEDCVQRCTAERSFVCRTAEYKKADRLCYLSWETLHTNSESHVKNDTKYVTYTRDCN